MAGQAWEGASSFVKTTEDKAGKCAGRRGDTNDRLDLQAEPVANARLDQGQLLRGQAPKESLGFHLRYCDGILDQKSSGLEKWYIDSDFEIGGPQRCGVGNHGNQGAVVVFERAI